MYLYIFIAKVMGSVVFNLGQHIYCFIKYIKCIVKKMFANVF